ncbi:MAG: hypothetical protein QF660_04600, partial [Anaerolineales bacterium]|nr:hypothetical protein [Anaerolineales bacterium]
MSPTATFGGSSQNILPHFQVYNRRTPVGFIRQHTYLSFVHKQKPEYSTANPSLAKLLLGGAGLAATMFIGAACRPEELALAETLRPPEVRYATMTLTPTVTVTASI